MLSLLMGSGLLASLAAQDFKNWQLSLLTTPKGWLLHSQTIVSPNHPPSQLTRDPKDCIPDECLTFKSDGTYTRTFPGSNCSGLPMKNTSGKWKYLADDQVFKDCILALQLDDEVNDRYDQKLMVVATAPEYGMLMLTNAPDQSVTYSHEIRVYKPRDYDASGGGVFSARPGSVTSAPASGGNEATSAPKSSTTPAKSAPVPANDLHSVYELVKQYDMPMSKTFDEAYSVNYEDASLGVISYDDLTTGTGPYFFVKYTTTDKRTFFADVVSDYASSSLICYEIKGESVEDITSQVVDASLTDRLLTEGFTWWNDQYFEGSVPDEGSDKMLVYSLPADNFITKNPYIFVELRVTWDEGSGVSDESRLLGQLNFNGKKFVFSWLEN